jgi:hypothetical protein
MLFPRSERATACWAPSYLVRTIKSSRERSVTVVTDKIDLSCAKDLSRRVNGSCVFCRICPMLSATIGRKAAGVLSGQVCPRFVSMQRAISWLMFAVLLFGSIAPAFAAVPPQPVACHRPQLSDQKEIASAVEPPPCHGMSGHAPHPNDVQTIPPSRDTIGKDNCCDGHDCCRRQDRSQGASLTAGSPLGCVYSVVSQIQPCSLVTPSRITADDHSGRAPPSL